ncbi:MAG: histone family protein [Candidatus Hodarchaeales archaeon]|jgi:histone H3/H4
MPKKKAPAKKAPSKKAPAKKAPAKTASTGSEGFAGARVERIIREMGAFRVSADAVSGLNEVITARGMEIAKYAVEIAHNSGRKTVKEDDVKLAVSKVG